jgi:N-acyl-D-amino-acid deacylase
LLRSLAVIFAGLLAACSSPPAAPTFDILIINGTVYDGSLSPGRKANIGVSGARIMSIDASVDATARTVIDANGKLVVPGFIDPHTHAAINPEDPAATAHINHLTQGVTTLVVGSDGRGVFDREATFARLEEQGVGANIAFLAGHGGIREAVLGYADRAPTETELSAMISLLETEMRDGALGLSTGLYYAPGSYSDTSEVVALAKAAALAGGFYDTHLRDEGSNTVGLIAAVEEAILIAREADIPVHISHIKALGKDVWGQSRQIVELVEDARKAGLEITANQYPWEASGTRISSALIPRWVMADSEEHRNARLSDPQQLPTIREEMRQNLARRGGPDAILVTAAWSSYLGKTLAEIAEETQLDAIDAAIEVVIGGDPSIASFIMHQDDIDLFAAQPWVMTGSDGGVGHPRFFATYPKTYQDFVVKREKLSIEQFIHRSSGQVADTLGLCDRGHIRSGQIADITIIDAENFLPAASYDRPTELSTGIDYLLVNGSVVIRDGQYQERRAGLILRGRSSFEILCR